MAKLIILEGTSRTGKTSIAKHLENENYGKVISIQKDIKMPDDLDLYSYYRGMFIYSKEFFKMSTETFILDRSFLSELVYSELFGRKLSFSEEELNSFFNENYIIVFQLINTYKDYINRIPEDKTIKYTKEDYKFLLEKFNEMSFKYGSNYVNYQIDTSSIDVEKTQKYIVERLKLLE